LTAVYNYLVVGFSFKPAATCTTASFGFSSPASSSSNSAVTSAESSQPSGFVFSRPLQPSSAPVNFGAGSFSFADTSGFSFKPPQLAASENKGEQWIIFDTFDSCTVYNYIVVDFTYWVIPACCK